MSIPTPDEQLLSKNKIKEREKTLPNIDYTNRL